MNSVENEMIGAVGLVGGVDQAWQVEIDPNGEDNLKHANQLFDAMERVVGRMARVDQNQKETRLGGVMIFHQEKGERFTLTRQSGNIVDGAGRTAHQKNDKYVQVAFGKFQALLENPDFLSSAQNLTDLPEEKQVMAGGIKIPGGAFRFSDGNIVVFSGFGTPQEDESAVLAARVLVGDMTRSESIEYAQKVGNDNYISIVDYLIGHSQKIPFTLRPQTRYERVFGDSGSIHEIDLDDLDKKNYEWLARILGWSHACPVVEEVILKEGPHKAAATYAELNLLNSSLLEIVKTTDSEFYRKLTATKERHENEPAGKYEFLSIPRDHKELVRGTASYAGYLLPRLVREFLGDRNGRNSDKFIKAYDIFEKVLKAGLRRDTFTPEKLVVDLAEAYGKEDVEGVAENPWKYLARLFSEGKLKEDNQFGESQAALTYIKRYKPEMWNLYSGASKIELKARKVANLNFQI